MDPDPAASSSDRYPVPINATQAELKIKRSTFLGLVYPIRNETQIRPRLDSVRKEYHKARHHCSAWRVGHPDRELFHYSDDGEPGGSAGLPIFREIQRAGQSDLLIIVVRWFGGIKLGTGGLARAYGEAARTALERSQTELRILCQRVQVRLPWDRMTLFKRLCNHYDAVETDSQPAAVAFLTIELPASHLQDFMVACETLLEGRGQVELC